MAQRRVSQKNPRHQSHKAVSMNTLRRIIALGLACMLLSPPLPLSPLMPVPAEAQQTPQPVPQQAPQPAPQQASQPAPQQASQPAPQQASQPAFKPEELDQLVAPIALHPDPLLAQILMASTYPLEVVEAARFAKDNAKMSADQLSQALQSKTWDDSVKSLVTFPQVLTMMNEKLDWLQKLGDAFLAQQSDLL